jgi:hypothetical protein
MLFNTLAPMITGKRSFIQEDFPVQAIAELIVSNIINNANARVVAIKDITERCSPDLRLLDRCTGKLLAYIEVQTNTNFIDANTYRYTDFLWYERRNQKDYKGVRMIFIYYDLNWGSYLITSFNRIERAMLTCRQTIADRYNKQGEVIQYGEKTFHLPLSIFEKNDGIERLDRLALPVSPALSENEKH